MLTGTQHFVFSYPLYLPDLSGSKSNEGALMNISVGRFVCSSGMCSTSNAAAWIFNETEMTHLKSSILTASYNDWRLGGGGITSRD